MGLQSATSGSLIVVENTLEAIAGFFTQPYNGMDLTYVPAGNGVGKIYTATTKMNGTPVQVMTITYNVDSKITNITVV